MWILSIGNLSSLRKGNSRELHCLRSRLEKFKLKIYIGQGWQSGVIANIGLLLKRHRGAEKFIIAKGISLVVIVRNFLIILKFRLNDEKCFSLLKNHLETVELIDCSNQKAMFLYNHHRALFVYNHTHKISATLNSAPTTD